MAFDDAAASLDGPGRLITTNPLGSQAIAIKLQSLEKGVGHIKDNSSKLGTKEDVAALRTKIIGQIKKAVGLTEDIELVLRRAAVAASGTGDQTRQRSIAQFEKRYREIKMALEEAVQQFHRLQHEYQPMDAETGSVVTMPDAANGRAQGRGRNQQQLKQLEVQLELREFGHVDAAIIEVESHM